MRSNEWSKKLKRENYDLFKELEAAKKQIDELNRSDAFSVKSGVKSLKPLKEDYVAKITKLERRIAELENENRTLTQTSPKDKENDGGISANTTQIQRENLRLRMKINELEHKLYQGN